MTGPVPVEETDDPALAKGKRVVDEFGTPPRETSVRRLVYDADGKLLYDNTWRSFYVGEPSLVRVGTQGAPEEEARREARGRQGRDARHDDADGGRRDAVGPTVTAPARP